MPGHNEHWELLTQPVYYVEGAGPNRSVQEESGRDQEDLQEEYRPEAQHSQGAEFGKSYAYIGTLN